MKNTKKLYGQPAITVNSIAPQQMICDSREGAMSISEDSEPIDPTKAASRSSLWDENAASRSTIWDE